MQHYCLKSAAAIVIGCLAAQVSHAGALDFMTGEQHLFCGVESYEDILETSCNWDASAAAAGNCNLPQYQVVVGKRPIYRQCKTLFKLAEEGPLDATPPAGAPESLKTLWRLLKALQPLAVQAVTVPAPACFDNLKPYPKRNTKADHEYYFQCVDATDALVLANAEKSAAGKIVKLVNQCLASATLHDPDAKLAIGELTLLLEDEGSKVTFEAVEEIAGRIK